MKKLFAFLLVLCISLGFSMSVPAEGTENMAPMLGGWQATSDETVTEETRALLNKAFDGIDGEAIKPIAVLGTQIVAGTNTCVLCRITPSVTEAVPYYVLIYIYEDLQGNVQLLQIQELELGVAYEDDSDDNG